MRKLPLSILLLAPLVAFGIYACDQGTPAEPETSGPNPPDRDLLTSMAYGGNPLFGAWWASSYIEGDDVFLAGDLRYVMILRKDGTFTNSVGNDNAADPLLCKDPPQTSCSWDGTYTYTATTITVDDYGHPDPDERGLDTHLYVRCGGNLTFLGDGRRLTFQRTGPGR